MKNLGIIAEYNPFHNGQQYHLREALKITGAQNVICVMSGNFVQRGEPALLDKWARTEIALKNGVDLVLELPVLFSAASAEYFALGAVSILHATGIVDCICFGSESGKIEDLEKLADIFHDESPEFKELLMKNLSDGHSYPKARELAAAQLAGSQDGTLQLSNNILAVEYLKALRKLGSPISPFTVKRIGSHYNDESFSSPMPSATAIRKVLTGPGSPDEKMAAVSPALASQGQDIVFSYLKNKLLVTLDSFSQLILGLLRSSTPESLGRLPYVSEGLENRLYKAAQEAVSIQDFLEKCQTSRYPLARLKRILVALLAGITGNDLATIGKNGAPYIKVLGFNSKGRALLAQMSEKASLPVITKPAHLKSKATVLLSQLYEDRGINDPTLLQAHMKNLARTAGIEARATDLYALAFSPAKKPGLEYTQNPVIIP